MKSFDEWLDTTKLRGYMDENSLEAAWEAGQQSKQAEVDELQNKIDEALKLLNLAYPESWAYCVDEAINILKGEDHES